MKKLALCFILMFLTSCQYFKKDVPSGQSYYEARWDEAVTLLRSQNFDEAEIILKELYTSAQSADPELATKALFELGQISEKNGQWLTALSQFKECETKKNYLQGFKAELELPARLAGLYATLGELKVSELYAKKVEASLQVYMQQISMTQQSGWWAETFFRMGSFPVQSINAENWHNFARRFHSTSQYLVRSMELSDPIWSEKSMELAHNFFKKSFEFLGTSPSDFEENSVLLGAQVRDRINLLQEILQKIQLYRPLSFENAKVARRFYGAVEGYQNHVKTKLYQIKDSAPLSQESQRRNAIEREGILVNPSADDIDKNPNDPNL